jgi:dynein heavy chain, axonemal
MKSFTNPPKEVEQVASAVLLLLSPPKRLAKDTSFAAAKRTMAAIDKFLESLQKFDKNSIPEENIVAIKFFLENPNLTGTNVRSKSFAAAGLCDWVRNIVSYYRIFQKVEPKRRRLDEANAKLCEWCLM